jgi:NitT/TauT family transport system permease protein
MAGETRSEPSPAASVTAPGTGDQAPGVIVAGAETTAATEPRTGDTKPLAAPRRNLLQELGAAFLPNRAVSPATLRAIIAVQAGIALLIWLNSPFKVLPRPTEVLQALQSLWMTQGLGPELITSFKMNLEALGWTVLISLALSYLTVLPIVRPVVAALSKGRFLSLVGFTLVFTLVVGGGRPLKVTLLVFGMTVFFVTSMAAVVAAIPKADFDHARTLRMSEWRVVWEVVILGTAATAFEVLRQNAAIGWMMLTMVEGISR